MGQVEKTKRFTIDDGGSGENSAALQPMRFVDYRHSSAQAVVNQNNQAVVDSLQGITKDIVSLWLNRLDTRGKGYTEIGRMVGRSRTTVRRHLIKGFGQTHVPNPYSSLLPLF